jgi:hypothetical protein
MSYCKNIRMTRERTDIGTYRWSVFIFLERGTNSSGVRVEETTGDFESRTPVSFVAGVVLLEAMTVGELKNVGEVVERGLF